MRSGSLYPGAKHHYNYRYADISLETCEQSRQRVTKRSPPKLITGASQRQFTTGSLNARSIMCVQRARGNPEHHGNSGPILATVLLYRIRQLDVLVFYPFTCSSSHLIDAGILGLMPFLITLISRPTRNQRGDCNPILATELLYCILQFHVFVFFPCTRTSIPSEGISAISSHTDVSFDPELARQL
jgi:hypothetical protein